MDTTMTIVSPKVKIILVKATKGYRWTVEVTHEDSQEALTILEQVEEELRNKYGAPA